MIALPSDFRDMLVELSRAGADFVVIGGYAVAFHGHPRATKDIDVLVRATPENAARVYRLSAFEVTEADFDTYDGVLQIGVAPMRIDLLNRAEGVTFDEAVAEGCAFELEGHRIPVIGLRALVANKTSLTSWR